MVARAESIGSMATTGISELPELSRFGLSFSDADIEAAFRKDRASFIQSQLRVVGAISAVFWLVLPLVYFAIPELSGIATGTAWLCWAFATPLCVSGVFHHKVPWASDRPIFMASSAIIFVCLVMVSWFGWAVKPSFPANEMVMFGGVFGLWVPFLRLPWKVALATIVIVMVPGGTALVIELNEAQEDVQGLIWGIGSLMATVVVITGVALSLESTMRQSFAKSIQIERQKASIEQSRDLVSRYVPASVSAHILEGRSDEIGVPQRRRVTVMFADISGFTEIADRVEPEVMTEVLGDHLSSMAQIIEANSGTLNEFAGDGLMALFGAPEMMPPEDQVKSAIAAAQAMQARMPALNQSWQKLGLGSELKIRVGIHTGMVSVGSYGSDGRMTYTAIGLQTNIASRIESAAEPGQILISDASFQLVREGIYCEPAGEIECKGVHYPVKVYSPGQVKTVHG